MTYADVCRRVISPIKRNQGKSLDAVFLEYFAVSSSPFVFMYLSVKSFFSASLPAGFSRLFCINCDSALIQPLQPFDAAAIIF